jgi:hypothetical protein
VVIAASSYDSTEGQPRWNAEADLAPPYGVINMIDLVTLCFNYGKKGLTLIGSQGCG